MKWIKASERLPSGFKKVVVKNGMELEPDVFIFINGNFYDLNKPYPSKYPHEENPNFIWLDESDTPSPVDKMCVCDFPESGEGCTIHPDKVDSLINSGKDVLDGLKQLNKIRDWLIEKSKDKPVGKKYSYDEVAILISEWQSTQSDAVEFLKFVQSINWGYSEQFGYYDRNEKNPKYFNIETIYELFKQSKNTVL